MTLERHLSWLGIWTVACGAVICFHLASVGVGWCDTCEPAADEIALYTENGACVVKGIGEHPVITLPGQDERSRQLPSFVSIVLGGRVEALACSDPKLTGICIVVSKSLKTFSNQKIGSAMSVVVRAAGRPPVCVPDATKVAVWDYQHFFGDCQVFDPGTYPYSIRPLQAGSLVVGAEARAKLCTGSLFESPCRDFGPGSYGSWRYEDGSRRVRGIDVYPPHGRCHWQNLKVTLYEYANFAGRCDYFDDYRDYSAEETWGWAGHHLHSINVGDEENATYALCWENARGRRECLGPQWMDVAEGLPDFDLDHPPSLTIARRQEPRDQPQDQQPEPEEEHSRTVWLAGHAPWEGPLWWNGRFPSVGDSDGTLTRVANPRNSVWLGFLKPGHGSDDCNDADAYVRLERGDTMTGDQMREAFGSETPELPITFVACSGAAADVGAGGQLVVPALPLNISYTEPR
jgi:hypothetical protein